jgi:hypothetical protein
MKNASSRSDRTGMLIAAVCFVHCAAGPFLLSFAGLSSMIGVSERFEPAFLLGSLVMGTVALITGYRKKHRRRCCLALFGAGFLCLLLRRHIRLGGYPIEAIACGAGAMLIVGAHALNLRFSKRCQCCEPAAQSRAIEGDEESART